MKPTVVLGPAVVVPADVAAEIGPALARLLHSARTDRIELRPDVVETIERLDLLGAAWRNRVPRVPTEVPFVDAAGSEHGRSTVMTVKAAAATLGITERAVTKRIATGSLAGHKDRGAWLVEVASVHSVKEPK